jgi:hypothetical protein
MRAWSKLFDDLVKFGALEPDERRFLLGAVALGPVVEGLFARERFEGALSLLAKGPRLPRPRARPSAALSVERGEALVKAALRATNDERCLPRSIVQFILHRRFGPAPRLVIGVRRPVAASGARELEAHAWIERDGGPVRDLGFAPMLSYSDARGVERPLARDPGP